jgi:hypothetical protein
VTPDAFEHAAAGWILAIVAVVLMLIQGGVNIAVAVSVGRARLRQAELGTEQSQHGVRIASLEQQSALTLLNTPKPTFGVILPQSWEPSTLLGQEKGNDK